MKLSPIDQRFLDLMHRIEIDQKTEIDTLRAQVKDLERQIETQANRITALENSLTQQAALWTRLNDRLSAFLDPSAGLPSSPAGSTD
jgi:capsule polysaccharide export protein KpsE/RkpR